MLGVVSRGLVIVVMVGLPSAAGCVTVFLTPSAVLPVCLLEEGKGGLVLGRGFARPYR